MKNLFKKFCSKNHLSFTNTTVTFCWLFWPKRDVPLPMVLGPPKLKTGAEAVVVVPNPTDFPNNPVFWFWVDWPNMLLDPNASIRKLKQLNYG